MKRKNGMILYGGILILAAAFAADLLTGSSGIPPSDVWKALAGGEVPEQTRLIVTDIRLCKTLTALLSGTAVSVSGLLMQTLFRNPLAGPYVLGISSGASLGAALCVLGISSSFIAGDSFIGNMGIAGAAWTGAAIILGIIMAAGRKIGDITVILILGMMLGAGIDAAVQILQYLSDEQSLKTYIVWTMGSLGNVSGLQLLILAAAVLAGLMLAAFSCKSLNLLPAGEEYAVSAGTDIGRTRTLIFISTVLLSGTATAFCGPLGFIGLAVPHIVRLVTGTADHRILVPGTALCGGIIMICCDMVTKLTAVPVNAVTSLIGIPVVIRVVIKYRKYA